MSKKDKRSPRIPPPPLPAVPLWKFFLAAAACFWAIFVTVKFDQRFPVSSEGLFSYFDTLFSISPVNYFKVAGPYLKSLVLLVLFLIGAAGWGHLVWPSGESAYGTFSERFLISTAIGLLFLSTSTFLLGLFPIGYSSLFLWTFSLVFIVAGGFILEWRVPQWRQQLKEVRWRSFIQSPVDIFIFILLLLPFSMAFTPELFYDSLVYHMGLPQMYINEQRFVDTPHVYFSRFPMLLHMLYTLGLGLVGTSVLPKLFNFSFLIIGLFGLRFVCTRLGWPQASRWAILLVLAIPVVQLNVWSTAIDAAMGTMTVLGFLAFQIWSENKFQSRRLAVIFGILVGMVFGLKYTGVVVALSFGGLLILARREGAIVRSLIEYGCLYGLAIFLVVSPWLIRNYVFTGNPTYPILASVFESKNIHLQRMKNEENLVGRSVPKSVKQIVTFPWTQTMLDISSFNFIGPMMLALLPILFFISPPVVREKKEIFIVTGLYFLIALRFSGDIRYLLPGFFLLSMLMAGGFEFSAAVRPVAGMVLKIGAFAVCCYHLIWIFHMLQGIYNPLPVILGAESRSAYSATMHNGLNLYPWNVMEEDLEKLPEPCRVYVIGTEQVYGFPKRFWYSTVHDYTPLVIWANQSADGEKFYQELKDRGFTHLLLNAPEAVRLKGYEKFLWTETGRRAFVDFANRHLVLTSVKPIEKYANSLFLFELRDTVDQPQPYGDFGLFFKDLLNLGPT